MGYELVIALLAIGVNTIGLIIAYATLRGAQRRDSQANDLRAAEQHHQNLEQMAQIRIRIEGLQYLGPSLVEVKQDLDTLSHRLLKVEGSVVNSEAAMSRLIRMAERVFIPKREGSQ